MATKTGTASFSGDVYSFKVTYSYTSTTFKITKIVVTGTSQAPYWANWELTPALYIYALKGSSGVPKSYQSISLGASEAKEYITDRNGKYQQVYVGNHPTTYLPTTSGGTKTWDDSAFDNIQLSLSGSSATITIGAFIANTTGTLNDVVHGSDTFTLSLYTAPKSYSIECTNADSTSLKITHKWTAGSDSITSNKIVIDRYNYTTSSWETGYRSYSSLGNGNVVTFGANNPIISNSYYKITGTISDGETTLTDSIYKWTLPVITEDELALELITRKEHNSIKVLAKANISTPYDQFSFSIDNGLTWTTWSERASSIEYIFNNLNPNTEYSVSFKMRNARTKDTNTPNYAGGSSSPTIITKSITTWHTPLSDLNIILNNSWYWYLSINADFNYEGNIKDYRFSIFEKGNSKDYISTGTNNFYAEGTIDPNGDGKLKYNTEYVCKVEVEDEYGRIYSSSVRTIGNLYNMPNSSNTFKTLDIRPFYLNGELQEIKLIRSNGIEHYVTPNMVTLIRPGGLSINLNKIINNDSRTEFK